MKKLINATADVLSESLAGFCAAHADIVVAGAEARFIARRTLVRSEERRVGKECW